MNKPKIDKQTMAVLVFLGNRVRWNRKYCRISVRDQHPKDAIEANYSQFIESWNIFQHAKRVAFEAAQE